MIDIEQLKIRQEQRLLPPLQAWNEAKRQLENAIALTEARQREYERVCRDVRQKLDALEVVLNIAGASCKEGSATEPCAAENLGAMFSENARAEAAAAG